MEHHFMAYMYRLRYIGRWSLMRNTTQENVAEHSYHVALLTHMLCTIANEIYGKNVPADRAVTASLFHDSTEVITGDIPTPVKHHNPSILRHFREIEVMAADRLTEMVPESLRHIYDPLVHGRADDLIRPYLKAADLLDAYLKCVTELSAGNREFAVAKRQTEEAMLAMGMEEVDYFLTHLAPSFEKTLDELSE
ncbi:5'-nucleotidase [Paenibacillus swuensis]|uniref:5'-nucleotidase n=1 Tax=Paenibacillus swuensis TaxID=1178515 RepID=A0A172TNG5_9BACL|nr:5'-deoxynucleotidase [Paenibacillus swuensis]ANE48434.1 5'-nucleotidase [Paenibacillus swuensis]